MTYLAKETLLWAYKKLSTLSEDPSLQGATQKVSAIRYALALDMFYKHNNRECNTRDAKDKAEFASNINKLVAINDNLYTTNFYIPLASHLGDCAVGSNFYSVGAVKNSLMNPSVMISYPQRGNKPLFEIQNGVLYRRIEMLSNINSYITFDEHKFALALWIVGKFELDSSYILTEIKKIYHSIFSDELCDLLCPTYGSDEWLKEIHFANQLPIISKNDIEMLFDDKHKTLKNFDHQQIIFYGAPGTGKSHGIKEATEEAEKQGNVFRTTFHPDSDYSTFIGAYKPTMAKRAVRNVAGDIVKNNGQEVFEETIVYKFTPQAFTNAYIRAWQTNEPVYLVIEEINRGNCAQIFGDLFQLLDRDDEGKSKYPIIPDTDLGNYIESQLLSYDNVPEKIRQGKSMLLPSNLFIWASMNTSDQSLFPIDSAFKRRWDWKYVPIENAPDKNYKIKVNKTEYDWWEFLKAINKEVFELTNSEDKQLGYFFVKKTDGIIDAETLVNKVYFYLWNDVFKDYDLDSQKAFRNQETQKAISFKEFFEGGLNEELAEQVLLNLELEGRLLDE